MSSGSYPCWPALLTFSSSGLDIHWDLSAPIFQRHIHIIFIFPDFKLSCAEIVSQVVFVSSSRVCLEVILKSIFCFQIWFQHNWGHGSQLPVLFRWFTQKKLDCFSNFLAAGATFLLNVWLDRWCRHSGQGLGYWISYLCAFQSIHCPRPGMFWFFNMIIIIYVGTVIVEENTQVMAYSYTMMALEVWNKQEFGQVTNNNQENKQK